MKSKVHTLDNGEKLIFFTEDSKGIHHLTWEHVDKEGKIFWVDKLDFYVPE